VDNYTKNVDKNQ